MKRIAIGLIFLLFTPLAAHAQKFELYMGYSFARVEGFPANGNLNGWEASMTYKLSTYLGITGDVSGNYGTLTKSSINFHSFFVGPQVSLPRKVSPFVHVLLGASRSSVFGGTSGTFSMAIGGGVDYRATQLISIRLIQADVITGSTKNTSSDGRISSGIVFRF